MDWNQVFEETGEEEGEWIENNEEDDSFTRLGYLQHLKHYSPVICYCFSVNYILGMFRHCNNHLLAFGSL